jgi:hypothetical protein
MEKDTIIQKKYKHQIILHHTTNITKEYIDNVAIGKQRLTKIELRKKKIKKLKKFNLRYYTYKLIKLFKK